MTIQSLDLPETTKQTPLKVYCDAAYKSRDKISAAGWHICTHNDQTVETHAQMIGKGYTTVEAEKEAIRRIINSLKAYAQVQHIILYTDCNSVLKHISARELDHASFEYINLETVERENNEIADMLAKREVEQQTSNAVRHNTYKVTD